MKNSKVYFFALIALIATACGNHKADNLKKELEAGNKQCPVSLGSLGWMVSMEYDSNENAAVLTYILDEKQTDIENLRNATEEQKILMANYLDSNDGKDIRKYLAEANALLKLKFIGDKSNSQYTISLTDTEIKEIIGKSKQEDNYQRQLESLVSLTNKQCPQQIAEGFVMTGTFIEGKYVVNEYELDSQTYDFSTTSIDSLRANVWRGLSEQFSLPANQNEHSLLAKLGFGVKYEYKFSASDDIILTFSPEEIRSIGQ